VRELIEEKGCELVYLPSYSPDLNPIEEAFAKVKHLLRKIGARTKGMPSSRRWTEHWEPSAPKTREGSSFTTATAPRRSTYESRCQTFTRAAPGRVYVGAPSL
jgi:transposase